MERIKELEEVIKSNHESFDVVTTIYTNNLEKMRKMEEDLENAYKTIDILTKNKYDPNGFDREGYNVNGLDRNGLDRNGIKVTKKKNQAKLKLAMQNLLKIKKEKDMLI